MEEMKTLKDLDKTVIGFVMHNDKDTRDLLASSDDDIREEAIKQREYKFKMAINAPDRGTKDFLLGQCAFIEEFFNLEDLK